MSIKQINIKVYATYSRGRCMMELMSWSKKTYHDRTTRCLRLAFEPLKSWFVKIWNLMQYATKMWGPIMLTTYFKNTSLHYTSYAAMLINCAFKYTLSICYYAPHVDCKIKNIMTAYIFTLRTDSLDDGWRHILAYMMECTHLLSYYTHYQWRVRHKSKSQR